MKIKRKMVVAQTLEMLQQISRLIEDFSVVEGTFENMEILESKIKGIAKTTDSILESFKPETKINDQNQTYHQFKTTADAEAYQIKIGKAMEEEIEINILQHSINKKDIDIIKEGFAKSKCGAAYMPYLRQALKFYKIKD